MKSFFTLLFSFSFCFLIGQETLVKNISHDGLTREYTIYVPEIYDGNDAVPLMLVFHGYGGTSKDMMDLGDFRQISDAAGCLLVYPQGSIDDDGGTHWNVDGPNSKSDADDLGFTNAILDELATDYNIDSKRVYACGYSNGGFFSFDLACKMSDRIAAVGSVAGTMLLDSYENCNPTHPTPVITIHGTNDFVVSYNGLPGWMYSMDQVNDFWVNYNQTQTMPTVVQMPDLNSGDGSTVEFSLWEEGTECVSVAHYRVINGGHDWPDVNATPSKTNVDVSASQLIWDFVSKHNIDGLVDCNTSSTDEVASDFFRLSPNPAGDFIQIELESHQPTQLKMVDLKGRTFVQMMLQHSTKVDIGHLPKGIYLLSLNNEDRHVTKKIIIQ